MGKEERYAIIDHNGKKRVVKMKRNSVGGETITDVLGTFSNMDAAEHELRKLTKKD